MRRVADAPPTIVASVAVGGVRHALLLPLGPRLVRFQRARALLRRHRFLGLPTLHRHYLLWVPGLALYVVFALLLLRGSRVAWWVRTIAVAVVLLGLLHPYRDAVLVLVLYALPAAELALLLTPSARAYVRQPPR